jgi:2-(3-amino-3-carboxypropyl)histidine synthase
LIIHFGHSSFGLKSEIPVVYIPYELDIDILKILEKNEIKHKKIGLVTTIQHLHKLNEIKDFLEKQGKVVFIGGQILGCKLDNVKKIEDKVDCILYVGTGKFHALGIVKMTEKPVLHLDVENRKIIGLSNERREIIKRRLLKESKLDYAKKVGILVSTKKGQLNKNVFNLKKKLEKDGKEVWILTMDYISPEKILGMKFDVLINTACPRIEDDLVFKETIINMQF